VRLHVERLVHLHQLQPHVPSMAARACQDRVVGAGAESADALGVGDGVDLEDGREVGELVDENFELQDHNDLVSSKPNSLDFMAETQLSNVLAALVVPDDHFVGRELTVLLRTDKREDVASEEHLDVSDPAVKLARDRLLEGVAVEDLEAIGKPDSEAALILIEADKQYPVGRVPR